MTPILLKTFVVLLYPAAIFFLFATLKSGTAVWYAKPFLILGKVTGLLCLAALFCSINVAAALGAPFALLLVLVPTTPKAVDVYVKTVSAVFLVCAILTLTGA